MNTFEITGKVIEFLGSKKIGEKTTKEDYLISFGKENKNGKRNNAVVSVFSFNKEKMDIQNVEEGKIYKFTLIVDGRQLANKMWTNNLKVINIQ